MRRDTALASTFLAVLALTGAAALPAQAAERPAAPATATTALTPSATTAAQPPSTRAVAVTVSVSMDHLGRGQAIADALRNIQTNNRQTFVQEAVSKAFHNAGGRHNVVLHNLSQNYTDRFQGTAVYANVRWGHVYFGLWIFESGEFTNHGDAGWINWGFHGWFERNGNHLRFHRSW
ncbi:hypothetical protein [Streptomyces sp. NPDC001985]|uniref:hypothetical protein n=1 Tax=Streptomyces sp. NPDC001985 TaxID=3154406 RepID=UPI003325B1BF